MPIIDEQGRLFGRMNVIDAAVAAAIVVLIPVAYAGYLLFRPAPVQIISVEPTRVVQGQGTRVHISGDHLRPYLRAQFGSEQLHSFLIETPTSAESDVPKLPPGTYDLTLFDETQQVAQLKNAITVVAPESPVPVTVRLVGAFINLQEATAKTITAGLHVGQASSLIDVVSAGAPREDSRRLMLGGGSRFVQVPVPGRVQVPAVVRAACTMDDPEQRCKINGTVATPDQVLTLGSGLMFAVQTIVPDASGAAVDVVVQFTGRPELIDQIKAGDRDLDQSGAGRLTVASVQRREAFQGQTTTRTTAGGVEQTITRNEPLVSVEATLRVVTDPSPNATEFNGAALKIGDPFALQTARYLARGTILRVAPAHSTNDVR